jgi:hypothetical protein
MDWSQLALIRNKRLALLDAVTNFLVQGKGRKMAAQMRDYYLLENVINVATLIA